MKYRYLTAILLLTLFSVSCNRTSEPEQISVTASAESYGSVSNDWKSGDAMALIAGSEAFTMTTSSSGSTATFSGMAYSKKSYPAVFPASAFTGYSDGKYTVSLSGTQTAVAGGFDRSAALAVAKGTSSSLAFANASSLISFTLNTDEVASIMISADASLSGGTAVVDLNGGSPVVTLTDASGRVNISGDFQPDVTYSIVVYPDITLSRIGFSFTSKDGATATAFVNGKHTIQRSSVLDLGLVDIPDSSWQGGFFYTYRTPGVYSLSNSKTLAAMDEYSDQTAWTSGSTSSFRMVNYSKDKYLEISGLPQTLSVGDSASVQIIQNYTTSYPSNTFASLKTVKISGSRVYMTTDDGKYGFIIVTE